MDVPSHLDSSHPLHKYTRRRASPSPTPRVMNRQRCHRCHRHRQINRMANLGAAPAGFTSHVPPQTKTRSRPQGHSQRRSIPTPLPPLSHYGIHSVLPAMSNPQNNADHIVDEIRRSRDDSLRGLQQLSISMHYEIANLRGQVSRVENTLDQVRDDLENMRLSQEQREFNLRIQLATQNRDNDSQTTGQPGPEIENDFTDLGTGIPGVGDTSQTQTATNGNIQPQTFTNGNIHIQANTNGNVLPQTYTNGIVQPQTFTNGNVQPQPQINGNVYGFNFPPEFTARPNFRFPDNNQNGPGFDGNNSPRMPFNNVQSSMSIHSCRDTDGILEAWNASGNNSKDDGEDEWYIHGVKVTGNTKDGWADNNSNVSFGRVDESGVEESAGANTTEVKVDTPANHTANTIGHETTDVQSQALHTSTRRRNVDPQILKAKLAYSIGECTGMLNALGRVITGTGSVKIALESDGEDMYRAFGELEKNMDAVRRYRGDL